MNKFFLLTITRSRLSPNSTTFLLFVTRVEARTCQATKHLRKIENRESVITNNQFSIRRTLLGMTLCALEKYPSKNSYWKHYFFEIEYGYGGKASFLLFSSLQDPKLTSFIMLKMMPFSVAFVLCFQTKLKFYEIQHNKDKDTRQSAR